MVEYRDQYELLKRMTSAQLEEHFIEKIHESNIAAKAEALLELEEYLRYLEHNQKAIDTPEQAIDEMVGAAMETREEYSDWVGEATVALVGFRRWLGQ